MTRFETISSPVLPMLEDRIDTDILFPARFLLLMERDGLGQYFCRDRRFKNDGSLISDSPLNAAAASDAQILIAYEDFGCGSSREQAVWSLEDFGIKVVIAISFGEIFSANCLRNGVLAIAQPREIVDRIAAAKGEVTVDLERQLISGAGLSIPFEISDAKKQRLLNGWDEIDTIVATETPAIGAFEEHQKLQQPWLYEVENV